MLTEFVRRALPNPNKCRGKQERNMEAIFTFKGWELKVSHNEKILTFSINLCLNLDLKL